MKKALIPQKEPQGTKKRIKKKKFTYARSRKNPEHRKQEKRKKTTITK